MNHSHLALLQKKHQALEAKIHREELRPITDTGRIKYYKLERLHLKERIERIRGGREDRTH